MCQCSGVTIAAHVVLNYGTECSSRTVPYSCLGKVLRLHEPEAKSHLKDEPFYHGELLALLPQHRDATPVQERQQDRGLAGSDRPADDQRVPSAPDSLVVTAVGGYGHSGSQWQVVDVTRRPFRS